MGIEVNGRCRTSARSSTPGLGVVGAAFVQLAIHACRFAPARADPANTLHAMGQRLQACLDGAHSADELPPGSEITILYALRRDGSLLGKPWMTHSVS